VAELAWIVQSLSIRLKEQQLAFGFATIRPSTNRLGKETLGINLTWKV
jgi:hypothetical protein